MRVKSSLINFKSKLSKSCNRFVSFFHFKVKRPVFIIPLHRSRHGDIKPRHHSKKPICSSSFLLSCLCLMNRTKPRSSPYNEKDDDSSKFMHSPLTPEAAAAEAKKLFTSPITTPSAQDACRSFEDYLINLIAEEGKMDDLMDLEELLFYWKKLKSPVFIELVSRFYGELCKDLFASE